VREQKSKHVTISQIKKNWTVVDAKGQTLGRIATRIATLLRGKHKVEFTPAEDLGDFVVVVNAQEIAVTGDKENQKKYYRHSGYPGGLKTEVLKDVRKKHPERLIVSAVKGMLPKNRLQSRMLNHLKVYAGAEHPHAAQMPASVSSAQ